MLSPGRLIAQSIPVSPCREMVLWSNRTAAAHSTTVIARVGGKSGAFGGAELTAATCSRMVISERGASVYPVRR